MFCASLSLISFWDCSSLISYAAFYVLQLAEALLIFFKNFSSYVLQLDYFLWLILSSSFNNMLNTHIAKHSILSILLFSSTVSIILCISNDIFHMFTLYQKNFSSLNIFTATALKSLLFQHLCLLRVCFYGLLFLLFLHFISLPKFFTMPWSVTVAAVVIL